MGIRYRIVDISDKVRLVVTKHSSPRTLGIVIDITRDTLGLLGLKKFILDESWRWKRKRAILIPLTKEEEYIQILIKLAEKWDWIIYR